MAVIRSSPTSIWKGIASAQVGFGALHGTFLARAG
jgi:hypothetical protein